MRGLERAKKLLLGIYGQPKYVLLNIAIAVAYYYLYTTILSYQDFGVALFLLPQYLLYALVATSSVLLTLAIYSVRNTRNNLAKGSSSAIGTATTAIGSVVAGCGCAGSFILGLGAVGITTTDAIALQNFVSANQFALTLSLIAINVVVLVYYIEKLSRPSCRIGRRSR